MNNSEKQLDASNSFEDALELIKILPGLFVNQQESVQFENGLLTQYGEESYGFESENGNNNFQISKDAYGCYKITVGDYTIRVFSEEKEYKLHYKKDYFEDLTNSGENSNKKTLKRRHMKNNAKYFKCSFNYTISYSKEGEIHEVISSRGDIELDMNIEMKAPLGFGKKYGMDMDIVHINPSLDLNYLENGKLAVSVGYYDHSDRINYIEELDKVEKLHNTDLGEVMKQIPLKYNLKDNVLRVSLPFVETQIFDFNSFPESNSLEEIIKSIFSSMGKKIDDVIIVSEDLSNKVDDVL